jgi:hypothetical protein
MIRRAYPLFKSAGALAVLGTAIALSAPAAAQAPYPYHRHHHHYARIAPAPDGGGDVVVRTGRNIYYPVDPYAEFLAGPHYFVDTALDTDPGLVHPFGHFGEAVLPSRFNPPGQSAPLFTFW